MSFYPEGQPFRVDLQNQSNEVIVFVHTADCESPSSTCVYGSASRWLEGPPEAGNQIFPGQNFTAGRIDDVSFFPKTSVLYFGYQSNPTIQVQIYVQMSGGGFEAWVAQYDTEGSTPSPSYRRAELSVIDGSQSVLNVRIPPVSYWEVSTRPLVFHGNTNGSTQNSMGLLNVALSTLTTACFVIPGAGGLAVGLTLLQGIASFVTSQTAAVQLSKIEAFNTCLSAAKEALEQEKLGELLAAMQDASDRFKEPNMGLNKLLTEIAAAFNLNPDISSDQALQSKMQSCIDSLCTIISEQSVFQKTLSLCLNTTTSTTASGPPTKVRLALLFSAISASTSAFSYMTMLREFIKATPGGWTPHSTPLMASIDDFEPERIFEWHLIKKLALENLDIKCPANVTRLGSVAVYWDDIDTDTRAAMSFLDAGSEKAEWGAGVINDATQVLTGHGLIYVGNKAPHPATWATGCQMSDNSPAYAMAQQSYDAYAAYLQGLISAEYDQVVGAPLTQLVESATPYLPLLTCPVDPLDENQVQTLAIEYRNMSTTKPSTYKFCFVKYGYSFANSAGVESKPLWQANYRKIENKARGPRPGSEVFYSPPMGARLFVPKDPWNARAESYAAKANKAAADTDPNHKTIPTPYDSAVRVVYRRMACPGADGSEEAHFETRIAWLKNSDPTEYFDSWSESLLDKGKSDG